MVASWVVFALQNVLFLVFQLSLIYYLVGALVFLLLPWIHLIIGYYLVFPREKFNRYYVRYVSRKRIQQLKENGLKVIGITGSYGKTSTKFFVDEILSKKYSVYATPKSHNTLFGIAQADFKFSFVRSSLNYLNEKMDYFLVEMGAYQIGEIEELCDAYPPDMGILTGITTMHYEKFGTIENTVKAKSELVEGVPDGGKIFMNVSNSHVAKIAKEEVKKKRLKVITYGTSNEAQYRAGEIQMTKDGSEFTVFYDDKKLELKTQIIGVGNVINITCAVAVGIEEGISSEVIVNAVEELEPIGERMLVMDPGTGIITINNGYSSNPESFLQTLETLKLFEAYFKILVTPGIFELGDITYEVHKELGSKITDDLNLVILLGKEENNDRLRGLRDGMKEAGYPKDRIEFITDISQCYDVAMARNLLPSVLVLENDLPDIYNI